MFLNQLNSEEKNAFFKLAVAVIRADERIEDSEENFLDAYAKEMKIPDYDLKEDINFIDVVKEIVKEASVQSKRIIFLELIACASVDGNISVEERNLIDSLMTEFNFSADDYNECIELLGEYSKISKKIANYISEGK